MNDADLDEPRSVFYVLARLFSMFQLLAAGWIAALCIGTLLTVERGVWLRDYFGVPELCASAVAAVVALGFEQRRCWARVLMMGECLLLPAAALVWSLEAGRTQGLVPVILAPAVVVGLGSVVGIFALSSAAVRNWCR